MREYLDKTTLLRGKDNRKMNQKVDTKKHPNPVSHTQIWMLSRILSDCGDAVGSAVTLGSVSS